MTDEQNTATATEKRCAKCGGSGPFYGRAEKGKPVRTRSHCIECIRQRSQERAKTVDGKASQAWETMNSRCGNRYGDHPTYANVECRISRTEFMDWFVREAGPWMQLNPGLTPTVDRVESDGHYEIGNIRILSLQDNSRLQQRNHNVHAPEGMAWCGRCKAYLPKTEFGSHKRKWNGLDTRCKACLRAHGWNGCP